MGWTIVAPRRRRQLTHMAAVWLRIEGEIVRQLRIPTDEERRLTLRGGGEQTQFSAIVAAATNAPLQQELIRRHADDVAVVRSLLCEHIGPAAESQLTLACSALLKFAPGCRQQELHMDIHERAHARRCFVVIVYLSACESTALPLSAATTNLLWSKHSAAQLRDTVQQAALFSSQRVEAGAVLIMRGDTAHYGPANPPGGSLRLAAYFLFSPSAGCEQASQQRYPHGVDA
jgi:hypothetical protein